MLEPFGPDLWIADGPTVQFMGLFPYPTRMAVVRLPGGGLWIWSPVALDARVQEAVDALGPVQDVVAPNKLHHLYLPDWQGVYPGARFHAPPGLARKRRDLRFDAELGDEPDPRWEGAVESVVFRGSFALEEVVFFHGPSQSALVCDLVQRFDPADMTGWRGALMRLDGLVGEHGSSPRDLRATWWRRSPARAARARLLARKPERLVVAHGSCANTGATELLARALAWLG